MMLDGTTPARRRRGDVLFACILILGVVCAGASILALIAGGKSSRASRQSAAAALEARRAAERVETEAYRRCQNGRAILKRFNITTAGPLRDLLEEAAGRTAATGRSTALTPSLRRRNLSAARRYRVLMARVVPFPLPACAPPPAADVPRHG